MDRARDERMGILLAYLENRGYGANACVCSKDLMWLDSMVRPDRFELPTFWFVVRRLVSIEIVGVYYQLVRSAGK